MMTVECIRCAMKDYAYAKKDTNEMYRTFVCGLDHAEVLTAQITPSASTTHTKTFRIAIARKVSLEMVFTSVNLFHHHATSATIVGFMPRVDRISGIR